MTDLPPQSEREQELLDRNAELEAQLQAARSDQQPAAVVSQPLAAAPAAATAVVFDAPAADLSIAPGSAGLEVQKLALLLEELGVETYLRRGENPTHVFDDELLASVRRVLSAYHQAQGDPSTVAQRLRDVAAIDAVHGDTWQVLRELAETGETVEA